MQAVPRHMFLEPGILSTQAYIDASLPIGHHQTISQPYIVARMIEVMRNGGELKRVLEIGTGCGYQAAVLSLVAKDVYSIERIKPLHELAKTNLRPLRIANIRLHYGDGRMRWTLHKRRRLTVLFWPPPEWKYRKPCWIRWQSVGVWWHPSVRAIRCCN